MSATDVVASTRVWPTKELSAFRWLSILAAVIAITFGSLILWLTEATGPGRSSPPLSPIQVGLAYLGLGLVATFVLIVPWLQTARVVRVSDSGVVIEYPLRVRSLPWSEVMRVEGVGLGTVTFRPLSAPTNAIGGWFSVSIEQARAILSDPRCPRVTLREDFRQSIFRS